VENLFENSASINMIETTINCTLVPLLLKPALWMFEGMAQAMDGAGDPPMRRLQVRDTSGTSAHTSEFHLLAPSCTQQR